MAVRPLPSTGAVAIAVLFFLLGVTASPSPSTFHENEAPAADADVSNSLRVPVSEINQILRLPSDAVADTTAVNDESSPSNQDPESAEPIIVRFVPLTRVRFHDFRPINRRHVTVRPRFPNRLCRHHHRFNIQPLLKPVDENMVSLTSNGGEEKKEELEPETVNWVKLPHHHHHHHHRHHHHVHRRHESNEDGLDGFSKYLMKHSYKFGREKLKKQLIHKRRDHNDDDDDDDDQEEEMKKGKKEVEGGIVQRVRKFLTRI